MMENRFPSSNPTHINFTTLINKPKASSSTRNATNDPMATDRFFSTQDDENLTEEMQLKQMQLISPPPEEVLRKPSRPPSATKRKRAQPISVSGPSSVSLPPSQLSEATPNPKPRKQSRHTRTEVPDSPTKASFTSPRRTLEAGTPLQSRKKLIFQSPHTSNPDADFVMPLSFSPEKKERRATLGKARRSATPIPPYEPPPDIFTPPRQVFINPPATSTVRSSRRKAGPKNKKPLKIVIKQEMPDIDLTLPMPPPSPSDDPLLLVGTREAPMEVERFPTPPRRHASAQAESSDRLPAFVTKVEDEVTTSPLQPAVTDDETESSPFPSAAQFFPPSDDEYDEEFSHIDTVAASIQTHNLDDTGPSPAQPSPQFDRPDWEREPLQFAIVATPAQESGAEEVGSPSASVAVHSPGPIASDQDWRQEVSQTNALPNPPEPEEVEDDTPLLHAPQPTSSPPRQEWGQQSSQLEGRSSPAREPTTRDEEPLPRLSAPTFSHRWDFSGLTDVERSPRPTPPSHQYQETLRIDYLTTPDQPHDDAGPAPFSPPAAVRSSPASDQDWDREELEEVSQVEAIVSPIQAFKADETGYLLSHAVEFSPLHFDDWDKSFKSSTPYPRRPHAEVDVEEEDSDSDTEFDTSLVKISSVDPRAAARAAAILKQHRYDCFTKGARARKGHSNLDESIRRTNLHDVSRSGVSKPPRRSALGIGVIGDKVIIPGTPTTTLPELLQDIEMEVGHETLDILRSPARPRNRFSTPKRLLSRPATPTTPASLGDWQPGEERSWTKDQWRLLDACFTDERLDVGEGMGGGMSPVDMININNVVDRFVVMVGGQNLVDQFGEPWSRDNLVERARALKRKQSSGNAAPPTPRGTPRSVFEGARRTATMEVPDFTPLGRRPAGPRRVRPGLPPPITEGAPFSSLVTEKKLPPLLLAPRYSHLLEEASSIADSSADYSRSSTSIDNSVVKEEESYSAAQDLSLDEGWTTNQMDDTFATEDDEQQRGRKSIGGRVRGFFFSYLPTLSKPSASSQPKKPRQAGLPLPPPDVLNKPRGPVNTPARPEVPKAIPPKELVDLRHASPPTSKTSLPPAKKPKRLVDLHHIVLPPTAPALPPPTPRPRRSSGSSVKDLVKGFEQLEQASQKVVRSMPKPKWK